MSEENNSNGLAKQEERSLGLACHLLAFVGMVFPFGNILGPLVIWLVKKDDSAFVDDQGKEALNFNITISSQVLSPSCSPSWLLAPSCCRLLVSSGW